MPRYKNPPPPPKKSEYDRKLTFKELHVGDLYISLPVAGDNSGHGGFLHTHWIFEKESDNTAVRWKDAVQTSTTPNMEVIKVG